MKVELTIKAGWAETSVILIGDKWHIEKIIEAINQIFKDELHTEIK